MFHEGIRNGRLEMACFEAAEDGNIVLEDNNFLSCGQMNGDCMQYYFDGSEWKKIGTYHLLSGGSAQDIVSSNMDVYDSSGNLIAAKTNTPFNKIDFSQYVN